MRHSRVARTIFAIMFISLFGVYIFLTHDTRTFSKDLESWGEATGMHRTGMAAAIKVTDETDEASEPVVITAPEATAEPEPTEMPEPELFNDKLPDIDINSWEYMLVNADNSAGEYAPPELATVGEISVDSRIADALKAMGDDAVAQGLSVFYSSGYRSYSEQAANFKRVCENNGISDGKDAQGFYISMPAGCSEHQTGLCCDITDHYYQIKDRSIENTEMYQYMCKHCHEFGFIVRYPDGKENITGVMYEPWHFRYVGIEAATYIMENNLTLEEFVALYR